jgi:hypothetical protein
LAEEPEAVRRAVEGAGGGVEPLLVVVEEAEALLEESLDAPRGVILRVIHAAAG